MKTVTTILIIFFVLALVLFGLIAGKNLFEAILGDDSTEEPLPVEEEVIATEDEPAEEGYPDKNIEEEPEEVIDPEEIAAIEIYLDGDRKNGIYLGEASYGLTSKEAYTIYGEDFSESGFLFTMENDRFEFEPGSMHYLYVYTLIPKYGWEYTRERIQIPGDLSLDENIRLYIDDPTHNQLIPQSEKNAIHIAGWSADLGVSESPGIDRIEVYLNGPRNFGKFLGQAEYGTERADVANAYGNANYTNSGYSMVLDGSSMEEGSEQSLYIYSYSTRGNYFFSKRDFQIEGEGGNVNSMTSIEMLITDKVIEVSGWVVSKRYVLEGKPRDYSMEYSIKKIIFGSNKNGNEDMFSINLDGSELTQLTDHSGKDAYPAVSPDGKKIAYTSDIRGTWQIMVMNWDGTGKTQLTYNADRSGYPTWSYDGRYIYFEVYKDGDWEIYRMDSDGSQMKRLTLNASAYDWHPSAHPFQHKIIYESGSVGHEDIYIMDYNGGNIQRVSEDGMRKRVPTISFDGSKIAFMGYEGNHTFVFVMDSNGQNIYKVTADVIDCGHPNFSPDGKYIVFQGKVDGQDEIFIINSDGGGLTRITNIPGNDWDATFLYQLP